MPSRTFHAGIASTLLMASAIVFAHAETNITIKGMITKIVEQERREIAYIREYQPLGEVYIQLLDRDDNVQNDQYTMGQMGFGREGVTFNPFAPLPAKSQFLPRGFVQMAVPDNAGLDQSRYDWEYQSQDFLGGVQCWVFDVRPKANGHAGQFVGRIWASEQDASIVRFDGTYSSSERKTPYVHFNSWRVPGDNGLWLPAAVYAEKQRLDSETQMRFKAQVNIWGYQPPHPASEHEFTDVRIVEGPIATDAETDHNDEEQAWRQAGDRNVLEWLQKTGIVAPAGDIEEVLDGVIEKLLFSGVIRDPYPITARILLTTPVESFTLNRTIILSRGLLDVLPDEPSLALVLARELSHIGLGHSIDSKYAFNNVFFGDQAQVFKRLRFRRTKTELDAADTKALELLVKSSYADQLGTAALFLRAATERCKKMPTLFLPQLGNPLPVCDSTNPLRRLFELAPEPAEENQNQVAALPLRSRVRVDPWSNKANLLKPASVWRISPKDKRPFETLPVMLSLEPKTTQQPVDRTYLLMERAYVPAWPAMK